MMQRILNAGLHSDIVAVMKHYIVQDDVESGEQQCNGLLWVNIYLYSFRNQKMDMVKWSTWGGGLEDWKKDPSEVSMKAFRFVLRSSRIISFIGYMTLVLRQAEIKSSNNRSLEYLHNVIFSVFYLWAPSSSSGRLYELVSVNANICSIYQCLCQTHLSGLPCSQRARAASNGKNRSLIHNIPTSCLTIYFDAHLLFALWVKITLSIIWEGSFRIYWLFWRVLVCVVCQQWGVWRLSCSTRPQSPGALSEDTVDTQWGGRLPSNSG